MDRNLPAAPSAVALDDAEEQTPLPSRQPVSVAFLPLALIAFIILALAIDAWTFLAAAT